jgi:hypothetical protein
MQTVIKHIRIYNMKLLKIIGYLSYDKGILHVIIKYIYIYIYLCIYVYIYEIKRTRINKKNKKEME